MILLDTHVWLWWIHNPIKLSQKALRAIEKEESLGVSVISCWEVAMLIEKGRLSLDRDVEEWVQKALSFPKIFALELTPEIAVLSTRLPGKLHQDPADRFLVATAKKHSCQLVTKDERLIEYPHVETIW
ncbi:MAG: type II toxin-antitoxin system VapC family toxin [Deltaproteobacteria bacterium]|nr:type II toxin-antitoxin system VapC family toxin [Deltaproteobacteria bacterium]